MNTIRKLPKVFCTIMLIISALLSLSCTIDPGRLEAISSASQNCRNIIGIEVSNITDEQRVVTHYGGEGVYVCAVIPNHPAYLGGLRVGDIITSINSIPVSNVPEALMVIDGLEAGRRYPFRICRMKAKPGARSLAVETLVFTAHILIEKVQERAIGRIS